MATQTTKKAPPKTTAKEVTKPKNKEAPPKKAAKEATKLTNKEALPKKAAKEATKPKNITEKDLKLLWGRSAGRCSMPDCGKLLSDASGTTTYGNICHIVAESEDGPRGKSILTLDERNTYSNLILLCGHHHDTIDKGSGPTNWPIERLHGIKTTHELWVETALVPASDASTRIVADVGDTLRHHALLDRWTGFSEVAMRDMLPASALDSARYLRQRDAQVLWPKNWPNFSRAARALIDAFCAFVSHFGTFSEINEAQTLFKCNNEYKRIPNNPNYLYWKDRYEIWSELNYYLLADLAVKANVLADCVRTEFNPLFFAEYGHFMLHDEMSYRGFGHAFVPSSDNKNVRKLTKKEHEILARRPA